MPTFALPVTQHIVLNPAGGGPIRRFLSAQVRLEVETTGGRWEPIRQCLIDTGASYTTMSATLARAYGIPFPPETSEVIQNAATGRRRVRVHDGEIRIRFSQLPGHTFRLYCLFVEETPPNVPVLIGLHDTLEVFRLAFDGRPAADAPAGRVVLETV